MRLFQIVCARPLESPTWGASSSSSGSMACPQCGSWSVRADRSLAGRMVCGRCGTPLQGVQRASGSGRRRRFPLRLPSAGLGRGSWRWWLLALLALSAALATLSPESRLPLPSRVPADAPTDRLDHRWQ